MLTIGDWPAWEPPQVRLIVPPPTGAAEAAWQAEVSRALQGGDESSNAKELEQRGIVGLGLSTALDLRDISYPGRAILLPSPTDSDLPASAVRRLTNIAETSGVRVAPASFTFRDPAQAAARAALLHLGVVRSLSVVVPNYNYGRYIADRLLQIDRQTYPVSEIIILDDASTDESAARIRAVLSMLSTPARLTVNAANSGSVFRQWEKGVLQATGELVWIAEADDFAAPDFLARLVGAFDDPEMVMAQSQSRQIGAQGEVRYDDYGFYLSEVGATRWAQSYRTDGPEQAASTLAIMNTIPNVSAVVFRRSALMEALASASDLESFRLAGDWLVYLEVLSRGNFAFLAAALNDHRVHQASVTTSGLTPLSRVLEVARMQKIARDRLTPLPQTVAAATSYLQKLYDYFYLAEEAAADVYDHPAFSSLAPG